jgi:transcriptional regulator GlxA family with amidase domain
VPSIGVVLFPDFQVMNLAPLTAFEFANLELGRAFYDVTVLSEEGGPIRTSFGMVIETEPFAGRRFDTVIVVGAIAVGPSTPGLIARVRETAATARRVAATCTGAFLLAEAGLLDGRKATTHWQYCDSLAKRHPAVEVKTEPIYVRDGNVATSAGVTTGIDLALALVEEDRGRDVALAIARGLVMFLRRPGGQSQFSAQLSGQVAHREPLREVQRLIADHPEGDLSVPALAAAANLSPRQFTRAFTAEVGVPPGRYVDRVRLETARRLLEDTADGIAEVARAAGYGTPEAMRRAFLDALGVSPAEYRRRF